MPKDRDHGGAPTAAPAEIRSGAVVDAQLHLEIEGVQVRGSLRTAGSADEDFEGWAGLIGAVLAVAGHAASTPLTPHVRSHH